MIQRIATAVMLAVGSIWDIRSKKIPAGLLILNIVIGGILAVANRGIDWRKDWQIYAIGILIGLLMFLLGRFCGGCVGTADAIMTATVGAMIGYRDTLLLLMFAFLSAAVFSILLIVTKRAGRKTSIPFLPFMLLGYLMLFIVM